MVPAPVPEAPGDVSKMPSDQQAHALGLLYSNAIDGWGTCEKQRAVLVEHIKGE